MLEVGEYVRTQGGDITKIKKYYAKTNLYECENGTYVDKENNTVLHILHPVKYIKNFIDLIEVGDIVEIKHDDWTKITDIDNEEMLDALKEDIEKHNFKILSILTKEQYEKNSYKLNT